jgi:Zn-dependent metalloprotease
MQKRTFVAAIALAVGMAILAAGPLAGGMLPGPAPVPGPAAATVHPELARANARSVASSYLSQVKGQLGLDEPDLAFVPRSVVVDGHGASHVRFEETYRGVPVFSGEVIAHVNNQVQGVFGLSSRAETIPFMDVSPAFGAGKADRIAKRDFHLNNGAGKVDTATRLVIYPGCQGYALAYQVRVSNVLHDSLAPAETMYFVDARSGLIIDSWDALEAKKPSTGGGGGHGGHGGGGSGVTYSTPVIGSGSSLYSGSVSIGTAQASDGSSNFAMQDLVRGSMYTTDMNNRTNGGGTLFTSTTNSWGNGSTSDSVTVGVDAHFGAEMTWDYYLNTFGRDGIYNDGKGAVSRVHYGRNYNNAFWSDSCKCMSYGDGDGRVLSPLTSLDVAGHEMSHGVTSATSNLNYSGEPGGLNEAFSDIMGTGVEFYAAAHGAQKTPNYWIGEDVYTPNTPNDALRYMDDPTKDGASIDNYADYYSGLDVHYSSGIWNNMFYLLAHGGKNRTSGISVSGIGIDKALAICYLANTSYFGSGETFHQARLDCIAAAAQLYGSGSTEAQRTSDAWTAVGVN